MTEDDAVTAILARLDPNNTGYLPAPHNTVPYVRQNESFTEPVDDSQNLLPWLYVEIEFTPIGGFGGGSAGLISIGAPGANLIRKWGVIILHAYVAVNSGDQLARQIAIAAGQIFESQDFGGVVGAIASLREGGKSENGKWWVRGTAVGFYFDE